MIKALGVFFAVVALDFVRARYAYAVQSARLMAGGYASAFIALSGAAAIGYTSDPILLIPAVLGAFCGTTAAVFLQRRRGR